MHNFMNNFSVNRKNSEKIPLIPKKKHSDKFEKLPKDILFMVVSFLELKDVIKLSEVSKTIRKKITSSETQSQYPIMRVVLDEKEENKDEQFKDHKVPNASWQQIFLSLKTKNSLTKNNFSSTDGCLLGCCLLGCSGGLLLVGDIIGYCVSAAGYVPWEIMSPILIKMCIPGAAALVCGCGCISCLSHDRNKREASDPHNYKIAKTLSFFKETPKDENTLKTQGIPIIDKHGDFIEPENEYQQQIHMNYKN